MAEAALPSKGDTLEGSFPLYEKKKGGMTERMSTCIYLYTHTVTQPEDNCLSSPQLCPLPRLTPVSAG